MDDDHRMRGVSVDSGVSVHWTDQHAQRSLTERLDALNRLATTTG